MTLVTTPAAVNADSYAAVADADAYFTATNNTAWAGATSDKEVALRQGCQYIENSYRNRWVGVRSTQPQSLAWPRGDGARGLYRTTMLFPLLDIDGFPIATTAIPQQLINAQCEAALLALQGVVLEPTLVRGGLIKSLSTEVDVIKKETVWMDGASPIDRYLAIEGILRGLVTSTPGAQDGTSRMVRG